MEANAFLPHQVRRTVGPLVEVGRGRLTVEQFAALLREAGPGAACPVAPAQGVCLIRVKYDDLDFGEEIETDEDI
jgi:tRNA pseudouridine38-40 synthase